MSHRIFSSSYPSRICTVSRVPFFLPRQGSAINSVSVCWYKQHRHEKRNDGRRNLAALAAAVVALGAGYALLSAGSTSLAAVLLVLGYVVLFPLAIAL